MVRVAHSPPSPMETRTPAAAPTNTRHKRKLRAYWKEAGQPVLDRGVAKRQLERSEARASETLQEVARRV